MSAEVPTIQQALRDKRVEVTGTAIGVGLRQPIANLRFHSVAGAMTPSLRFPLGTRLISGNAAYPDLILAEERIVDPDTSIEMRGFSLEWKTYAYPSALAGYSYGVSMDEPDPNSPMIRLLDTINRRAVFALEGAQIAVWATAANTSVETIVVNYRQRFELDLRSDGIALAKELSGRPPSQPPPSVSPARNAVLPGALTPTSTSSDPGNAAEPTVGVILAACVLVVGALVVLPVVQTRKSKTGRVSQTETRGQSSIAPPIVRSSTPLPKPPVYALKLTGRSGPLQSSEFDLSQTGLISRNDVGMLNLPGNGLAVPDVLIELTDTPWTIKSLNRDVVMTLNRQPLPKKQRLSFDADSMVQIDSLAFRISPDARLLIVTAGPLIGQEFEVPDAVFALIRGASRPECLVAGEDDGHISSPHALIRVDGPAATLMDLFSSNGTFVDGREILRPTKLIEGSIVRLGTESEFVVERNRYRLVVPSPFGEYFLERALPDTAMSHRFVGQRTRRGNERGEGSLLVLKMPADNSDEKLERFEREVAIASRMDSPRIVRVRGSGKVDGRPYLALDFIDGCSLADLIDVAKSAGGMAAGHVSRVVRASGRALLDAYAKGIVCHRDVKPSNLMIDLAGEVFLLDFGVAKLDGPQPSKMTRPGALIGTPEYMCPEAGSGSADQRTDIFSLGIVIAEMLTGDLPQISDLAQIALGAWIEGRRPGLPPALLDFATRCAKWDPADRFPDVADMLACVPDLDEGDLGAEVRSLRKTV